eukprot:SAG22_NODE_154_length_17189_cov_38.210064_16_plen_620_part_00
MQAGQPPLPTPQVLLLLLLMIVAVPLQPAGLSPPPPPLEQPQPQQQPAQAGAAAAREQCTAGARFGWGSASGGGGLELPYGLQPEPVPRLPWGAYLREHGGEPGGWRAALLPRGTPIIFTGGVGAAWPATRRWGHLHYWTNSSSGGAAVGNCYLSTQRSFRYYDTKRPLAAHFSKEELHTAAGLSGPVDLDAADLFREPPRADHVEEAAAAAAEEQDGRGQYRYCSIDDLPAEFWADLPGVDELQLQPGTGSNGAGAGADAGAVAGGGGGGGSSGGGAFGAKSWLNIWLGDEGTAAHPHSDPEHNLYSVVVGAKLFHLWPPDTAVLLGVHPYAHPGGRQAQGSFAPTVPGSPEAAAFTEAFPAVGRSRAWSTGELQPGEMLYVPPFWMHHVLSLGAGAAPRATDGGDHSQDGQVPVAAPSSHMLTIALNIWTASAAEAAFSRMQRLPLPIPAGLPLNELVGRTAGYIDAVERRLVAELRPGDAWEAMLSKAGEGRHRGAEDSDKNPGYPAVVGAVLRSRYRKGTVLTTELLELAEDALAELPERALRGIEPGWCAQRATAPTAEERAAAAAVAAVLSEVAAGPGGHGVAATLMADFAELVANAAFGLGDAAFFLACFGE